MKLQLKLLLLIFIIFTASCSGKKIGYVVMLWPPEDVKAETGEVIKIISQSDIRNVYVIEKKEDKYRAEIPRTSGRFFKKIKEAESFAAEYAEFKDTYAYSEKSISVRKEADASSDRVYKLRPSQMVKVISKGTKAVNVGNLTGYWFRVLTDDGYEGYCFDKYLKSFELDKEYLANNSEKEWLNDLFDNKWYPAKFREIVESGRIIISRIKTGEGLFLDRDKKQFVIQTEEDRIEFYYESINRIDERRYFFEGTPVEVNFYPNMTINVKFVYKGIDYSSFYSLLDLSLDEYVEAELARRNTVYKELLSKGEYLTSDLYGSIVLKNNRKFIWTGYVNLVPDMIPFGCGITGKTENKYYLSERLAISYDGILSFIFERNGKEINFVYYMTDEEGIEFIYLPPDKLEEDIVSDLPDIKEIFYFRQGMTLEESMEKRSVDDSPDGMSNLSGSGSSDMLMGSSDDFSGISNAEGSGSKDDLSSSADEEYTGSSSASFMSDPSAAGNIPSTASDIINNNPEF